MVVCEHCDNKSLCEFRKYCVFKQMGLLDKEAGLTDMEDINDMELSERLASSFSEEQFVLIAKAFINEEA